MLILKVYYFESTLLILGGKNMVVKQLVGLTMDCKDIHLMAEFYNKLLGWEKLDMESEEYSALRSSDGWIFSFQRVEGFIKPVWPWAEGKQQQMIHFDFCVDNLEEAVKLATELGATKSEKQYYDTTVVMFDPEGHPFCLMTETY